MRTNTLSKSFLLLFSGVCLFAWQPSFAQGEDEAVAEEVSAVAFTQGQAAVLIVRRLGMMDDSSEEVTQGRAVQLLEGLGVAPKGGWDESAELTPGDLARLLVQALGLEAELTAEQIAGDDNGPYVDLLIEKYNVDVEQLVAANSLDGVGNRRRSIGLDPTTSSDPLLNTPMPDDNDALDVPVSQADVDETLNALAPAQGGDGGQVDDDTSNMTPSAPVPDPGSKA